MSDLHELTASEQLAALRARQITSRELVTHYLDRIDRLGSPLGAFVTVTADLALREADGADARRADGDDAALLGLPLGVKDLHPTAGVRTTLGSAALSDLVPDQDSWAVGLLRSAGSVLLGKTHAPELGPTCFTESRLDVPPAVTPYDPTRYSSGSSGGAATAVAAGLLPVAHASDGAGSIRTPASTCHLVGFKPSRGLVSPAPSTSLLSTSTEGPIARTVGDAALLLDAMSGPAPGDIYGWRPTTAFTHALDQEPRRLRVAMWTGTGVGQDPDPDAANAVRRTAELLEALGHVVEPIALPAPIDEQVHRSLLTCFGYSVAATVRALVPDQMHELLAPYTRYLLDVADRLTADDIVMAHGVLAQYASAFLSALDGFDVALTPTTNGPPAPIGYFTEAGLEQVPARMLAWSCYTPWVNFTGQPAVSLPVLLDARGLPHGVQLVAGNRKDAELFSLAAQLERAQLWPQLHPPLWDQA